MAICLGNLIAAAPNWTVNPFSYQYSLSVTARIDVNCQAQNNNTNMLAAFVGNVCRGVVQTNTVVGGNNLAYLLVYSNSNQGEVVTFKFYDAIADSVFNLTEQIIFAENGIHGNGATPLKVTNNEPPTAFNVVLSPIYSSTIANALAATFSITDVDYNQYTYSFIPGANNNNMFSISGNALRLNSPITLLNGLYYSVDVLATDPYGCTISKNVIVRIEDFTVDPNSYNFSMDGIFIAEKHCSVLNDTSNIIAAYINGLCRGSSKTNTSFGGNSLANFKIYSNLMAGDEIYFKLYDAQTNQILNISDTVLFASGSQVGSNSNPYPLHYNNPPTALNFNNLNLTSTKVVGANIATLSVDDIDFNNYAYSFVAGNNQNSKFNIVNNKLQLASPINLSDGLYYVVDVLASDGLGCTIQTSKTIGLKDFTADPANFSFSMDGIFEINKDCAPLNDSVNFVAAYVNNVCRGSARTNTIFGSKHLANFKIYSNSMAGDVVYFKYFDTQGNQVINALDTVLFVSASQLGTNANPYVLNNNNPPSNYLLSFSNLLSNTTNGSILGQASVVDLDGDIYTITFDNSIANNNNSSFSISYGVINFNDNIDLRITNIYKLGLTASDGSNCQIDTSFFLPVNDWYVDPSNFAYTMNIKGLPILDCANQNNGNDLVAAYVNGNCRGYARPAATAGIANIDLDVYSNLAFGDQVTFKYYQASTQQVFNLLDTITFDQSATLGTINAPFELVNNHAPTSLSLNNVSINSFNTIGDLIATIDVADIDGNAYAFNFVNSGSNQNDSFNIVGNQINLNSIINIGNRISYDLEVEATDGLGCAIRNTFTLNLGNWSLNPLSFNHNMKIIGLVNNNCTILSDTNILVGAYVNGDIRGVAKTNILANGNHVFDMTAFSNSLFGDSIVFKYYNPNNNTTNDLSNVVIFSQNAQEGSFTLPYELFNNAKPSQIVATNTGFVSSDLLGDTVLALNTIDADNLNHSYTFINSGSNQNDSFLVANNYIILAKNINLGLRTSYTLNIRSTDAGGCSVDHAVVLNIDDWTTVPGNFSHQILGIGQVEINCSNNALNNDLLAAYNNNNVCVGVGNYNAGLFNFDIYNNTPFGAELNFKYYNAASNTIYNLLDTLIFNVGTNLGTVINPHLFTNNTAPTALNLNNINFFSTNVLGNVLADFTTTDADASVYTYQLNNAVVADNDSFSITGNQLILNSIINVATKRTYTVAITSTDGLGCSIDSVFTINIADWSFDPGSFANQHNVTSLVYLDCSLVTDSTDIIAAYINGECRGNAHVNTNVAGVNYVTITVSDHGVTGADITFKHHSASLNQTTDLLNHLTFNSGATTGSFAVPYELTSNNAPTLLNLDNTTLFESSTMGTVLGNFTVTDVDGDPYTYSFDNTIPNDNASFGIIANQITLIVPTNVVTTPVYVISVTATDGKGCSIDSTFTVTVINDNAIPTGIVFIDNDNKIAENKELGTEVGFLGAIDSSVGDVYTYALVEGAGDDHNDLFSITGDKLFSNFVFDYETQKDLTIRISVTDQVLNTYEQIMPIEILDEIEDEIFANNVMTPNGDGVNDAFEVRNFDIYAEYSLNIFNEKGQLVFEAMNNYDNTWQGKDLNSNELADGKYYYILANGNKHFKGIINIIK